MSFTPNVPYDTSGNAMVDSIGYSAVTVDIDHFLIHIGSAWIHSDTVSVENGANKDFYIKNGATKEIHIKEFTFTSSQGNATVIMYKTPTTTGNGTQQTWINKHLGLQALTPYSTIYQDPTVTAVGTQLEHFQIVGGKQTGGSVLGGGDEWVIPVNTNILMRYTNNGPGTDSMSFTIKVLDIPPL